ncbi:reprolysin-like metallopeptidase [Kaistella palustris]|uniref:reprolysin-like metallopeptidase n=1 Tax=Kaistella palustris TaxID=493376 RepID=UPI0004287AD3|nr:zinc-dependent metalloprotease family protein [Kaistella palustris]
MKTKSFIFSCLMFTSLAFGQNYWTKTNSVPKDNLASRDAKPKEFSIYQLNLQQLKSDLATVPQRFSKDQSHVITFPAPDGKMRSYIVQEASVMEAPLQAKYPELRSYVGYQKGNPANSIRFSVTPEHGVSAMYFDGWDVSYLDSYTQNNSHYIFYKRSALPVNDRLFDCKVEGAFPEVSESEMKAPLISDGQFRTYRLALAATGEYTTFHGGTVPKALAAMVVAMTRVDGVYEKSVSVTMVLVANTDELIYTNAATDPYTNNNGSTMLGQNQTNIDSVIGFANYDIGHVFSTGGGGVAYLGCICKNNKAGGVTGLTAPINDGFYIDYVAHEMGHQFGGNHTFRAATGSCAGNANSSTAFEPGGGTTIMAYAGICGANNIQAHSDPYFHSATLNEIYNVLKRATDCSVKTTNNNLVPTADAGLDYTIPKGTAFVLTGVGTDPDNDPITYLWEQLDNSNNTQPPLSTAVVGPVYRSYLPTESPSRYFPAMSFILLNNLTPKWEVTPSVARTLNFSLIVNDDRQTGNQAARDLMKVTVDNAGPFTVTSQTANTQYDAADPITVTWDVAGTDAAPINTQNVTILLSNNNGSTFDVVLSESVPNNGSAQVNLPNEDIASARIMVKALDNIYFAVNASYFSVKKNLATANTQLKSFAVYPNPAKNEVTVKMNKAEGAKYRIFDATGRVITSGKVNAEGKLNVEKLTNGNYILSVETASGEKFSDKLMIKK